MQSSADCQYISSCIDYLSSFRQHIFDCFKKLFSQYSNTSLFEQSREFLDLDPYQYEELKQIIDNFSLRLHQLCDQAVFQVYSLERTNNSKYKEWKSLIGQLVAEVDSNIQILNQKNIYTVKEPTFVYHRGIVSKGLNTKLIMKYPESTLYKQYKENLSANASSIYIDQPADNDRLIVQYMQDDPSLLKDIKQLSSSQKQSFLKSIEWHHLPLNYKYVSALCCNEAKEIIEALKDKRIVSVNGNQDFEFTSLLKQNNALEPIFENQLVRDVHIDQNKTIIINIQLNHPIIIKNYLQNQKESIDTSLLTNSDDLTIDDIEHDFQVCHLQLEKPILCQLQLYLVRPSVLFTDSKIIDRDFDSSLAQWTGYKSWKLIFRASEHHFSSKSFHRHCDNKGPTLIVIKSTQGYIFGGFTTQSWNTSNSPKADPNAFIYSLRNPFNVEPTQLTLREKSRVAITCKKENGPFFGVTDLVINDQCDQEACRIGNNDTSAFHCHSIHKKAFFVGTNDPNKTNFFKVFDYEVFVYM